MKTIPYAPGTWRTVHKNTMVIYLADNVTSDAALLLCERLCTEHKMEVRRNGNLTIRARSPRSKDGEAFYVDFKTGQHATKGNMLLVEYDNGEQVDVGETVATILVVVLVSVVIGLLVGGAVNAGSHHGGCGGGGGHHHHHSGGGGGHHHHHSGGGGGHHHHHSGGGGGHHHHHHHHQHHHRSSNFIMPLYISSSFSSSSSSSRTYTRQLRSGVQATVTYDEYNNPQRQMSPVPCTDFATRQAFFYYFFENLAAAAHSLEYAQVPYDASPLMLQAMPLTPHKALEGHTNDGATFYSVYVPDDATVRVDIAGAANLLVRAVKGDHRPKWYSGGQARPFATANFSQALVLASGAWTVGVWHAKMGVHTTFHIAMSEPVALEQSVEAAMGDSLSSLDCLRPSAPPQYDTLDASGSSTSAVPTKSGEQETEEDDEGEGEDEGWTLLDAETIAKDVVATTRRTYGPASFRQVGLTRKTENT